MDAKLIKFIRHRMLELDIRSVRKLAAKAGLSGAIVYRAFAGDYVGMETKVIIGQALGISADVMVGNVPLDRVYRAVPEDTPAGEAGPLAPCEAEAPV